MYILFIETIRKRQHLVKLLLTKSAEEKGFVFSSEIRVLRAGPLFDIPVQCPVLMVVSSKVYTDIILFLLKKPH